MRRAGNSRTANPRALATRARQLAVLVGLSAIAALAALTVLSAPARATFTCPDIPVINGQPGDTFTYDDLTSTSVTVSGYLDPSGYETEYQFVIYDVVNKEITKGPKHLMLSDAGDTGVEQQITGLVPGRTYYFDILATNVCGEQPTAFGSDPPRLFGRFITMSRVDVLVDGEGTVSSSAGSLTCDSQDPLGHNICTKDFNNAITLNASPSSGVLFLGWTGACTTTSTTCVLDEERTPVIKTGPAAVTAHFGWNPLLNVTMAGTGSGRVTSSPGGISCVTGNATGCEGQFPLNSTVTLTAVPDAGSMFVGWGSDETSCSSSAPTCTKKLAMSTYVTAQFAPAFELVVSVDGGSGGGTVKSTPSGIDCPGICNAYFPAGAEVELTATPKPSSTFVGWDGACFDRSPLAPCSLVITGDTELNAEFSNPLIEAAGAGAVVRVNQTRNGATVRVRRGDTLLVSLPANKTTGFAWHLTSLDRRALKLVGAAYVDPKPTASPSLGAPGSYSLSLKALKKSKSTLKLSYSRGGGKAVKTFKLRVVVR